MKNKVLFLFCIIITQKVFAGISMFCIPIGMAIIGISRNKQVFTQEELEEILAIDVSQSESDIKNCDSTLDISLNNRVSQNDYLPPLEFISDMHGYQKMEECMYRPITEGQIRDQFDREFTQEKLDLQWQEIKKRRSQYAKPVVPGVRYSN